MPSSVANDVSITTALAHRTNFGSGSMAIGLTGILVVVALALWAKVLWVDDLAPASASVANLAPKGPQSPSVAAAQPRVPEGQLDRSSLAQLPSEEALLAQAKDWESLTRKLVSQVERGPAVAQAALALLYAEGQGVPRDAIAAERLWILAADRGDRSAQHNLGTLYARGVLGVPDPDRAREWYARAAQVNK